MGFAWQQIKQAVCFFLPETDCMSCEGGVYILNGGKNIVFLLASVFLLQLTQHMQEIEGKYTIISS